jgi:hypothetical protein
MFAGKTKEEKNKKAAVKKSVQTKEDVDDAVEDMRSMFPSS